MLFKKSTIVLVLLVLLAGVVASANVAIAKKPVDNSGIVVTHENTLDPGMIMPMSIGGSITQGQSLWYSRGLSGFQTDMHIDLYWGNPSNSLRMTIYSPDGAVYGPFYDNCDGRNDGYIPCHLYKSSGLPQGTYYVNIYGSRVFGTQSFTLY